MKRIDVILIFYAEINKHVCATTLAEKCKILMFTVNKTTSSSLQISTEIPHDQDVITQLQQETFILIR